MFLICLTVPLYVIVIATSAYLGSTEYAEAESRRVAKRQKPVRRDSYRAIF
jgi:hypothetical protein